MGPPHSKTTGHPRVRWLLETPPLIFFNKGHRLARALLEQKQLARARIQVRFQLELELCFEFVFDFSSSSSCGSNSCPSLSWLEFEIEKLLENGCLSWLRLQKFRKQFEKMKGLISKLNAHDLTRRLGQGPANHTLLLQATQDSPCF